MKRFASLALTFAIAISGVSVLGAQASGHDTYTQAEIKEMIRAAHTTAQYQVLATYFKGRQQYFELQAQSEKAEWERRSQITAASYQKYPRPADTSWSRYQYFTSEAQEMGAQADHFESLSGQNH